MCKGCLCNPQSPCKKRWNLFEASFWKSQGLFEILAKKLDFICRVFADQATGYSPVLCETVFSFHRIVAVNFTWSRLLLNFWIKQLLLNFWIKTIAFELLNKTIAFEPLGNTLLKRGQMSKFVQKAANLGLPSWSPVTIGTINFLLVQVATQFKYTMSDFMSRNENKSKKPGVRHRAQAPTDKKVWSRRWKTTSTPTPPPGNQNLVVRGIFWKTTWYFEIIFRKNNSQFNFFMTINLSTSSLSKLKSQSRRSSCPTCTEADVEDSFAMETPLTPVKLIWTNRSKWFHGSSKKSVWICPTWE